MIAEADPAQIPAVINSLRATWPTIAGETYVTGGLTTDLGALLEERRRELWMQGHKLGDMLRVQADASLPDISGYLFDSGFNQRSQPYGTSTCYPLPLSEKENNPNF